MEKLQLREKFKIIKDKVNSKGFRDGLQGVYGKIDDKTFETHKKNLLGLELI